MATPAVTPRQTLDAAMSERQFMDSITQFATVCRWRWSHPWNSMHSAAGWPDLTLVRGTRLVFAEVKRQTGKVTAEQQAWLDALAATGAEAYVWRPSDWDAVIEVLR